MNSSVIIGYDHTPSSEHALTEAAFEAVSRSTALTVVHAFHGPPPRSSSLTAERLQEFRDTAEKIVEEAAAEVRQRYPGLSVEARAVFGDAAAVLAEASRDAQLLVVGSRGRGGFTGLLLGSVSMRVLTAAWCPVIVARGSVRPGHDRVLAVLDVDAPCDAVLEFAFTEASRRSADLVALYVWDEPWILAFAEGAGVFEDLATQEADRRARLDAVVRPRQADHPDVPVKQLMKTGTTATIVMEASNAADLLVVGARRHSGGRHGVEIGPVAHTSLRHAACPVAVVPWNDRP